MALSTLSTGLDNPRFPVSKDEWNALIERFGEVVSASDFDVVGDGEADDFGAFQRMLESGAPAFFIPEGTYALSEILEPPSGAQIGGVGNETVFIANALQAFKLTDKDRVGLRKMKITPLGSGSSLRSAILMATSRLIKVEDVVIEGQTDAPGIYQFDCDDCVVDSLYFDGGPSKKGTAVYNSGGRGCKVTNSTSVNCFAGFTISSAQVDADITPVASPRAAAASYGNSIAACDVRSCTSQAYTITGSTHNTISACHAEDYAGASTHKAFQVKDATGSEYQSIGNVVEGCTVKNYPAAFGGQGAAHAQFIGCTGRDISINGLELSGCRHFQFVGCSLYDFTVCGIWLGASGTGNSFSDIRLQTSTATAIGIKGDATGGANTNCNFDNITTPSTLAKFADIGVGCNNWRFGDGCRTNANAITDSSGTAIWPLIKHTPNFPLTATADFHMGYAHRGMHVAAARFIPTAAVSGGPRVSAGIIGSTASICASQVLADTAAGTAIALTIGSAFATNGKGMTGSCTVTGTGEGYIQLEGFPLS